MKPQDKKFDGSSSLFETRQLLENYAGNAVWLTQFRPVKQDHVTL